MSQSLATPASLPAATRFHAGSAGGMPAPKARLSAPDAHRRGWTFAWLLAAILAMPALAGGFRIESAKTHLDGETYVLDARILYGFSELALEALDNGVPLTIELHMQVRPRDAWIWEDNVLDRRLRYAIRYKPLSERFLVSQLPGEGGRSFVTRDAAIAALGEIKGLPLVGAARLDPNLSYEVQLKAELDIEELPLPLRPMAYLRPAWKLSTGWTKWPIEP
jgi:Domain of unknown function (DUF4390)